VSRDCEATSGYSLVEVLVALALTLAVVCGVLAIVNGTDAASSTLGEAADIQQRARVSGDALWRDLAMAGAGFDGGALAGPLVRNFAAVVPRRVGLQAADPVTTASSQAISVLFVPRTSAQTTTSVGIAPAALQLQVNSPPNCPVSPALCGLRPGAGVVVIDPAAPDRFALFTLADVAGATGRLVHRALTSFSAFEAGAPVAEVEMHTYYFDSANHQLRDYDGYVTDVPLIDHVVGLRFDYFGDPRPPSLPQPPAGVENCLYDASGSPRPMPVLTPEGGSLAPLPLGMLSDGPWCGSGADAFDADLLRVRRVRVSIRLEAASAAVRATGPSFANPGTSRSALRSVPDYVVAFDVSPRNLSPWR
jgi:hypothetical protein